MTRARFVKWGKGLAVRIPKAVIEQAGLRAGDSILIEVSKRSVQLPPVDEIPTLEELVAQITPENRHGEIDWGPAVGNEI